MNKLFLPFVLTALSTSSFAEMDLKSGMDLHNESCVACHGSEMYTREPSKITNNFDLRRQVSYCRNNLSIEWFPDEEQSVVGYLNSQFYHFNK